MPIRDVRRLDVGFQRLQPVTRVMPLADEPRRVGLLWPAEVRQRRRRALTEVGEHQATHLRGRIGRLLDPLVESQRGAGGVLHTVALGVESPTVIDALDPVAVDSAGPQRHPAMDAVLGEQSDPALGVTERDQVLPQQPDPNRR